VATEKQRRRRAKEQRHEYEIVYLDDEGNEVEVEEEPHARKPPAKAPRKGSAKPSAKAASPARGRGGRGAPQPPSWPRVLKRGAIFAPIFLATVLLLGGKRMTFAGALVQTILLIGVFIPFSYFMDRLMWRLHQKRHARGS
jgi:hypothetical protein